MGTGKVGRKVCAALLGVFLAVSQAIAATQQAPVDELAQLKEKLIAAQGDIATGNLEAGQKALDAIKQAAQEKLSARWQFVTKLSEAVTLEKAGKLAEADAALRQVTGQVSEPDQFLAVFATAGRLVQAFNKANMKTMAVELVTFLSSTSAKDCPEPATHGGLSQLWLSVADPVKAEASVTKAAQLAKTETQWKVWTWWASSLMDASKTTEEKVAVFGRLAAMTKTAESRTAKEALGTGFLSLARTQLSAWEAGKNVPAATTVFHAVKDVSGGFPELERGVKVVEQMILAHTQSQAGDHAGAVAALQNAYQSAKGKADEARSVGDLGAYLARMRVEAKDNASAVKLIESLAAGPAQEMEPWDRHTTLAWLWLSAGDAAKAEGSISSVASLAKTEVQWKFWATRALPVMQASKTTGDRIAVFGRLVALAKTEESRAAKEALGNDLLALARTELSVYEAGKNVGEATTVLQAVKNVSGGVPELERAVKVVEQMILAHTQSQAGDQTGALQALQSAAQSAKANSGEKANLFSEAGYFVRSRLAAKDTASASKFVEFAVSGPEQEIEPWTRHTTIATFYTLLDDAAKAETSLSAAASVAKTEAQWKVWATYALPVIQVGKLEDRIAAFGRLMSMAKTDESRGAKEALGSDLLALARTELSKYDPGKNVAVAVAMLDAVGAVTAELPELHRAAKTVEQMAAAHTQSGAGNHAAALQALQNAHEMAKGKPDEMKALCGVGAYLARRRVEAKDNASAVKLIEFVAVGPAQELEPWDRHTTLASLWISVGEFAKAEASLGAAAAAAKTETQWKVWATYALPVMQTSKTEDRIAAFGRLMSMAKTDESRAAKELFGNVLLMLARAELSTFGGGANVAEGTAILDAVKKSAVGLPELDRAAKVVEQMSVAYTWSQAGDHAAALQALQNAYRSAKGKPDDVKAVCDAGEYLFRARKAAKDNASAGKLVEFLAAGPALELQPLDQHTTLARLWTGVGGLAKAEEHLRQAAALVKDEDQWRTWAQGVLSLMDGSKTVEEGLTVLGRLAPLAQSDVAKTSLALIKPQYLVHEGEMAEAEDAISHLKLTGPSEKQAQGVATLRYLVASVYGDHGQASDAYRNFKAAEVLTKALSDADHEKLIRNVFYVEGQVVGGLLDLLARSIREAKDQHASDHAIRPYCEAAAAMAKGDEAISFLGAVKAKPSSYLYLAESLRRCGDIAHARKALAAIPKSALGADPELAKAVAEFWQSR